MSTTQTRFSRKKQNNTYELRQMHTKFENRMMRGSFISIPNTPYCNYSF